MHYVYPAPSLVMNWAMGWIQASATSVANGVTKARRARTRTMTCVIVSVSLCRPIKGLGGGGGWIWPQAWQQVVMMLFFRSRKGGKL